MRAGITTNRLKVILTAAIWLVSGGFVSAAEYWQTASNSYARPAGMTASAPVFSNGTQLFASDPRIASQLGEPQFSDLNAEPFPPSNFGDPFGSPPNTLQPYVPLSLSQAYDYDSFDGNLVQLQRTYDNCLCSWFCVPTNGHVNWIEGQGDDLGFVEFDRRVMFTNPFYEPLRIVPGFATRYVSGPVTTDLPAQLFDTSLEVAATLQLADEWTLDVGLKPGLYGDYRFLNYDTFRLGGHAVASRPISPTTQAVLGFVYLSREDIPALPVVGFVFQPSPDIKWDLVFPRPRVAVRVGDGYSGNGWLYLRGELGGNSWSIQRANDHRDVATYRDLRLILGYETLVTSGIAANLETGWVFSRKLMYESGDPDFTPRDTFLIRAGLSY